MILQKVLLFLFCPVFAFALCAREAQIDLYKGPGLNYQKSWQVGLYMPFEKIEQRGKWLKVRDVDNESHWVESVKLVANTSCVVVKEDKADLRLGPGFEHARPWLWNAEKYSSFKKLSERAGWIEVEDSNQEKFWLEKKNVWISQAVVKLAPKLPKKKVIKITF